GSQVSAAMLATCTARDSTFLPLPLVRVVAITGQACHHAFPFRCSRQEHSERSHVRLRSPNLRSPRTTFFRRNHSGNIRRWLPAVRYCSHRAPQAHHLDSRWCQPILVSERTSAEKSAEA